MSLRTRMVVTGAAAAAAALLVILLLATPGLRRRALAQTKTTLLAEARLLARVVEPALARGADPAVLDSLVDMAAREMQARVPSRRQQDRVPLAPDQQ